MPIRVASLNQARLIGFLLRWWHIDRRILSEKIGRFKSNLDDLDRPDGVVSQVVVLLPRGRMSVGR